MFCFPWFIGGLYYGGTLDFIWVTLGLALTACGRTPAIESCGITNPPTFGIMLFVLV